MTLRLSLVTAAYQRWRKGEDYGLQHGMASLPACISELELINRSERYQVSVARLTCLEIRSPRPNADWIRNPFGYQPWRQERTFAVCQRQCHLCIGED